MSIGKAIRRGLLWFSGFLVIAAVLVFTFVPQMVEDSMNIVEPHEPYAISDEARALHGTLAIADLHADTLLWGRDPLKRSSHGHVDLPRLQEGNVTFQVFTAVTKSPSGLNYDHNTADSDTITSLVMLQRWPIATWRSLTARGLHIAKRLKRMERERYDTFKIVRTVQDLDVLMAARAEGREFVGGMLAFEGAHILDGKIENVKVLWDAGYRMASLQHFFDNKLGGSLHGASNAGLTEFGKEALAAFIAQGFMIDIAHSSVAVVEDVLALTDGPLVVSHTGIRSVCDTKRNFPDDLMKRIADRGGVIGIGYWDGAVCDTAPENVVRVIRAAIDLLGVEHVALGSDYDGATTVRFDTSELAVLTQAMLDQGFSEDEIRAVMGGNTIRFMSQNLPRE